MPPRNNLAAPRRDTRAVAGAVAKLAVGASVWLVAACSAGAADPVLEFGAPPLFSAAPEARGELVPVLEACALPADFSECTYLAGGVRYHFFGNRLVGKRIQREGGAFMAPLPFGLTGEESERQVLALMRPYGLDFDTVSERGLRRYATDVLTRKDGLPYHVRFEFSREGRLESVEVFAVGYL